MATVACPPERLVILDRVSWETYERLLAEHGERNGTRFTYDGGVLEIMVLSSRHEMPNRTLAALVEVLAEEWNFNIARLGSTTIKREDLQKGFEPDSCFYIQHAAAIRGKEEIDLNEDPAPDLTIEVDITRESLNRFPIFAAVGIPEVWRFDGTRVTFFQLDSGSYIETECSLTFPSLSCEIATEFLNQSQKLESTVWLREVRDWARSQKNPGQ
ncbi:MAG: Uma2 family endonuclease [Acidobacteriota bacterium]